MSERDKRKLESVKFSKLASELVDSELKKFDKEFLTRTMVIIRVYILKGISLAQMDDDSLSDPYIKIKLGNKSVDVIKFIILFYFEKNVEC